MLWDMWIENVKVELDLMIGDSESIPENSKTSFGIAAGDRAWGNNFQDTRMKVGDMTNFLRLRATGAKPIVKSETFFKQDVDFESPAHYVLVFTVP